MAKKKAHIQSAVHRVSNSIAQNSGICLAYGPSLSQTPPSFPRGWHVSCNTPAATLTTPAFYLAFPGDSAERALFSLQQEVGRLLGNWDCLLLLSAVFNAAHKGERI